MNNILIFLQSYSKIFVQLFGVYLIYKSFSSNNTIVKKSGTYWDFNIHLVTAFVSEDYNKYVALMVIAFPEILTSLEVNGLYIYIFLGLGIISQIAFVKNYFVNKRVNKIKSIIEESLKNG